MRQKNRRQSIYDRVRKKVDKPKRIVAICSSTLTVVSYDQKRKIIIYEFQKLLLLLDSVLKKTKKYFKLFYVTSILVKVIFVKSNENRILFTKFAHLIAVFSAEWIIKYCIKISIHIKYLNSKIYHKFSLKFITLFFSKMQ